MLEHKDELKKDMDDSIEPNEDENKNNKCDSQKDEPTKNSECCSEKCKETKKDLDDNEKKQKEENEIKESSNKSKEYEDLLKEKEEISNRFLRLQADFSNYKKRVAKDKEKIYAYAAEELITQLLPTLDNFDRALSSITNKDDEFYKGMEMIYKQTIKVLENYGLKEIKAIGEKFDPNFHHAAATEKNDKYEENTIIEVFQKGYLLKDKVIRPSIVKVIK